MNSKVNKQCTECNNEVWSAGEGNLSEISHTFTSTLNLPTAVQSIIDKVRQTPIQVYRCQAALKSITRGNKLWEVAIHALSQASNVEIA